jgi:hypothetical protein
LVALVCALPIAKAPIVAPANTAPRLTEQINRRRDVMARTPQFPAVSFDSRQ